MRTIGRVRWAGGLAALLALGGCAARSGAPSAAEVVNASRPTACAEEDNVYVTLHGKGLRSLRIEARQPRYIGALTRDSSAPDFSGCNFDGSSHPTDPRFTFTPKRVVLWEDAKWRLVGLTQASFWRAADVDVVVADKVEKQVHLLQLFLKDAAAPEDGAHELLVVYPPDGYWRAKPMPAPPHDRNAYGTSFLVGPIEEAGRPVVQLRRVAFVPERLTFHLTYRDGTHGQLQVAEASPAKLALDYTHDRPFVETRPFAAIRSMFVATDNADAAEVRWQPLGQDTARTDALPTFARGQALEVCFGRSVISRHNASAPDLWFGRFAR